LELEASGSGRRRQIIGENFRKPATGQGTGLQCPQPLTQVLGTNTGMPLRGTYAVVSKLIMLLEAKQLKEKRGIKLTARSILNFGTIL